MIAKFICVNKKRKNKFWMEKKQDGNIRILDKKCLEIRESSFGKAEIMREKKEEVKQIKLIKKRKKKTKQKYNKKTKHYIKGNEKKELKKKSLKRKINIIKD